MGTGSPARAADAEATSGAGASPRSNSTKETTLAAPMKTATELVDAILEVEESGVTKKQVKDVLECLAYVGLTEIESGNRFRLPSLGTIEVRVRNATKKRKGRNPRTGEEVMISAKPASTRIGFRALKPLKDALPSAAKARQVLAKNKPAPRKPATTTKKRKKK